VPRYLNQTFRIDKDISFPIELEFCVKSNMKEENVKEVDAVLCIFSLGTGFGHTVDRFPDNQALLDKEYWLILNQTKTKRTKLLQSRFFQNISRILEKQFSIY